MDKNITHLVALVIRSLYKIFLSLIIDIIEKYKGMFFWTYESPRTMKLSFLLLKAVMGTQK